MNRPLRLLLAIVFPATLAGCSSELPRPPEAQGVTGANTRPEALRGLRYCEVLVGGLQGAHLAVDVYNTIGLNECPDADWSRLDSVGLAREIHAERIILNGPRYWTVDRLGGSSKLADPTPRTFRSLPMRLAARIEMPISDALGDRKPYAIHDIQRTTVWIFEAGKPIYELLDAEGHSYVMQSYSIQKTPQTSESLATLGERIHPPRGWVFRTRVLTADLEVPAVDGVAHIVQDDFENTYQRAP
jgi:hypothetical protein